MKPIALLACTSRWFPASRLAIALASSGFRIEAVCPSRHSLPKLRCVSKTYGHYGFSPIASFEAAIRASTPDVVVPCDDVAVRCLHQLYERAHSRRSDRPICELIERSLGSPGSFEILYQRAAFLQVASELGIRVPATQAVTDWSALESFARSTGLPLVLKADSTSGGEGVRIIKTLEEAARAFHSLSSPPLLARAIKRALIDQDSSLVAESFCRRRATLSAQTFVRGHEATSTVVCWKGAVLAALHFEVINKSSSTGHSTVLRLIENAEMSAAAAKIAQRLGLSGMNGFDFILEAETGNPYLIEINARATQVGHLTLGKTRDLPAMLFASVTGEPVHESSKLTDNAVIALFPQEWRRDPSSSYLCSGYHDVPWDELELLRACVGHRRKQWTWYAEKEALRGLAPVRAPRC